MKRISHFGINVVLPVLFCLSVQAQWIQQKVDTSASFRGLSVVNEKVIWASGTGGTVIRTVDGGKKWNVIQVPDAAKLDFRDIEAFDANTAYILSIGNGESSRIYKTTNGGKTWNLQFKNTNEKAFFDAIACLNSSICIAMSDPVGGNFLLVRTLDGEHWESTNRSPAAKDGEAAFAASGTCLIWPSGDRAFLVSGGVHARVHRAFARDDTLGLSWDVSEVQFAQGSQGSGIFSIAMFDSENGVIVGGNYEKPNEANDNLAFTTDGGKTWKLRTGLSGYRSGVTYVAKKTIIAVGTNGSDISRDGGKTWNNVGAENLNTVSAKGKRAIWAVGPKGGVYNMK